MMHENAMQLKQKALKIHPLLGQNWGFKAAYVNIFLPHLGLTF